MIYKDFKGLKLSALGMGCMRLPKTSGDDGAIDEAATAEMVDYALSNGINYFDTAWGYHNGMSESVIGNILHNYPRDSFYLASKFPGYSLSNFGKSKEIFEKQLEKCKVDYFDFYLLHCLSESNLSAYLDKEKYGDTEYIIEQKKNGRIRHLGFSAHGSLDVMREFLEAYGKYMEFCQIQLNYYDWTFQYAKEKVELLSKYGIPVWVMEPVRGGMLAKLDDEYEKMLKEARPDEDTPAWAFRFIETIPEVKMVLSGMSNFDQVKANVKTFSESKPLDDKEKELILSIADSMIKKASIPCTACHYCTSHCPMGLDIPHLISLYNEHRSANDGSVALAELSSYDRNKLPSACLGCQSCEAVCPQQIKISEVMKNFTELLK